jgi:hypothetical protein
MLYDPDVEFAWSLALVIFSWLMLFGTFLYPSTSGATVALRWLLLVVSVILTVVFGVTLQAG